MYRKLTTFDDAKKLLSELLWDPWMTFAVIQNTLLVDRRFMTTTKGLHEVEFVKSVMERRRLPNMVWLFDWTADGFKSRDSLLRSGCPHPAKMPRTEAKRRREPVPKFVMAKRYGHDQCGILVPNAYFDDLTKWGNLAAQLHRVVEKRPFAERRGRVFWRGAVRAPATCDDEAGNFARVQALSLGLTMPDLFDIQCVFECTPRRTPCPEFPYDDDMLRAIRGPYVAKKHVPKSTFAQYKYQLNLPGSVSGSYSRNLNHLWLLGSVVLLWQGDFQEFYYPALEDGVTHLIVNKTSAPGIIRHLVRNGEFAKRLATNARTVFDTILCPDCLADYFLRVVSKVRSHFAYDLVLDNSSAFADLLRTHVNTSHLQLIAIAFDDDLDDSSPTTKSRFSFLTEQSQLLQLLEKAPPDDEKTRPRRFDDVTGPTSRRRHRRRPPSSSSSRSSRSSSSV